MSTAAAIGRAPYEEAHKPEDDKPMMKGVAVVWGVRERKPIVNLPPDTIRVKVRMRPNDCARAFVWTAVGIEHWILQPTGPGLSGDWKLGLLQGVNEWRR